MHPRAGGDDRKGKAGEASHNGGGKGTGEEKTGSATGRPFLAHPIFPRCRVDAAATGQHLASHG